MNTFHYDLIVLAVTLPSCFVYNFFLYKHPEYASKKGFTYFLLFLAIYPLLNSVAHLLAVGAYSIIRMQAGVFQYDIRFYTLIQFGVLLLLINGFLLRRIKQISRGNWKGYRQLVFACILQSMIVLPLVPFNPISLLPFITSVLLILRLEVARRGRKIAPAMPVLHEVEKPAVYV